MSSILRRKVRESKDFVTLSGNISYVQIAQNP